MKLSGRNGVVLSTKFVSWPLKTAAVITHSLVKMIRKTFKIKFFLYVVIKSLFFNLCLSYKNQYPLQLPCFGTLNLSRYRNLTHCVSKFVTYQKSTALEQCYLLALSLVESNNKNDKNVSGVFNHGEFYRFYFTLYCWKTIA